MLATTPLRYLQKLDLIPASNDNDAAFIEFMSPVWELEAETVVPESEALAADRALEQSNLEAPALAPARPPRRPVPAVPSAQRAELPLPVRHDKDVLTQTAKEPETISASKPITTSPRVADTSLPEPEINIPLTSAEVAQSNVAASSQPPNDEAIRPEKPVTDFGQPDVPPVFPEKDESIPMAANEMILIPPTAVPEAEIQIPSRNDVREPISEALSPNVPQLERPPDHVEALDLPGITDQRRSIESIEHPVAEIETPPESELLEPEAVAHAAIDVLAGTVEAPEALVRAEEHPSVSPKLNIPLAVPNVPAVPAAPIAEAEGSARVLPRRARIEELPSDRPPIIKREEGATQPEPSNKPAASAPEISAKGSAASRRVEELFANREGKETSAAAWAIRLAKAYPDKVGKSVASTSPTQAADVRPRTGRVHVSARVDSRRESHFVQQRPLDESRVVVPTGTRRFLKPLVGIDPASVPIRTGQEAAEIAAVHTADAVTIDETVVLGSGHVGESPQQLGLLAHEFTHVARQRQPGFIPPIARNSGSRPSAKPSVMHMDEEALARRVEARVMHAAETAPPDAVDINSTETPEDIVSGIDETSTQSALSPEGEPAAAVDQWGGLPAPWEPFPDWVSALQEKSASIPSRTVEAGPANFISVSAPAVSAPIVQRAEVGRSLSDEEPPAPAPATQAETPKPVAPDLDVLAKQVYAVLKRRLDAERRRELK
jgi:uncharacterized protein DUF4157